MTDRNSASLKHSGFTLIELVIVLGITGLIFSGLWGLLTSGSTQLQAQSAAQQYRAVIEATRKYITSGVAPYVSGQATGLVATPPDIATLIGAGFLPNGFATKDAYGNDILIAVDTIDASKQQWRFSVYGSNAGLTDKVGAQVSSLIGSEGGFVYNNTTDGCAGTASQTACGSFNSFALPLASMGITNGSGRIVTLAYTIDYDAGTAPWLYRKGGTIPDHNTMSQSMLFSNTVGPLTLNMQGNAINMSAGNLAMGTAIGTVGGGGKLTLNGGNLSMGADGLPSGGGTLFMGAGSLKDVQDITGVTGGSSTLGFNDVTVQTTSGNIVMNAVLGTIIKSTAGAPLSLDIKGVGKADEFQAGKFIYSASDITMKENLLPMTDALEKLMQIRAYSFNWKGTHNHDVGLMAQDVQKVFPEIVTPLSEGKGKLGIEYAKMVAPIIEAIRELKQENEALRKQVDALQERLHNAH